MESTLHKISMIAALAGGAASVFFVLYTGRRNPSVILMAIFVIWVLTPFLAMVRLAVPALLSLTVAVLSTSYYGWVALGPSRAQPAAPFLIIPAISWAVLGAALLLSRHNNKT